MRPAAIVAMLAVAGCNGATAMVPPMAATVLVQVGPGGDVGQNDATVCKLATHAFSVPADAVEFGARPIDVVQDGSENDAGTSVHVRCSVRADGDAFDVHGDLTTDDGVGASISGTMSHAGGQAQAAFVQAGTTFASQDACSVDFTQVVGMDIEPGRVWAVVTCPRATDGQGNTCFASAEFLFVDCEQ